MARPLIDPGMARPTIYPYISIYNLYIRKKKFSLIRTVSVLIGGEPRSRGWVWPSLLEFPYICGLVIHGSILFHILVWLSAVSVLYYILVWLSPDPSCPISWSGYSRIHLVPYLGLAIHSLSLVLYPGLAIPGSILPISWSGHPRIHLVSYLGLAIPGSILYYILVWLSPDPSCLISWSGHPRIHLVPYLGLAIHSLSLVLYPGLAIPGSILSHILVWPSPDPSCTISWSGYPGFILSHAMGWLSIRRVSYVRLRVHCISLLPHPVWLSMNLSHFSPNPQFINHRSLCLPTCNIITIFIIFYCSRCRSFSN